MRLSRLLLLTSFLLFCLLKGKAQEIAFSHLTTKDGLLQNSVMAFYQDNKGFIWVGTRNGVNLYNGNEFIAYKYKKDEPNSLIYNNITGIAGDGDNELYFMTPKGISAFDISRNRFETIIQGETRSMYFHKQLYISMEESIYRHNGKKFEPFYSLKGIHSNITALYVCEQFVLIGTDKQGVFKLNKEQKLEHPILHGNISSIFKDSTGKFWISTWDDGIYLLNGASVKNLRHIKNNPSSLSSDFVRNFCEDKQGNIWIGTFEGLNCFNPSTQSFTYYQKNDRENSLTHSSIWSLLCDEQGTIWVGTYFGGINYFNPKSQAFRQYHQSKKEGEGLSSSIVGCMAEDDQHNLWIGTEGGGVNKYNIKTGTFKWYKSDNESNSLSHNNVKSIYYDKQNHIMWIGTHLGGLNKLDMRSGRFTCYQADENNKESIPSNIIRDIVPYKNQLVLATHKGICLFNPADGKSEWMFQNETDKIDYTAILCIDHRGTLWFSGGGKGVYSYRFDTQKLTNYMHNHAIKQSISSNSISRIYEDSNKRLWFCTNESGIDRYRYETDDFENFDEKQNKLESNCVYDMCELSTDRLLFTTDSGFSILDYQTREFSNYNKENGMPLSAINERSIFKASNGKIFIGGIDGMISFEEKDIDYVPQGYSIYPFRLIVNGKEIVAGDQSGILQQALAGTNRLVLKSNQSIFSIEYAILNYISSNKDEIEYQLNGFSNTWTSTRGQHTITYTNLSPGKYTLIVRAKNNPMVPVSKLEIEILPPFYRTAWAYLLYIVCIGIILYYLTRTYNHRIKLQESLKYEKKHTEDIERLNQAKLRFFTNISHEFRTPLTLIIGQMEMLLQVRTFAPTVYNKILGVYKSSLQLRELITELLDFRKQEQGYMNIKVSEHNMVDFVYENYLLFQEYAIQRQITLNFRKTNDTIPVWYDVKQMQKVMNNLLSNAFKHVSKGGEISVSIRKGNKEVIIEVTDNGAGIASKDIDQIFNRFYQTEQMESLSYVGTGIGLSLTKGIVELHHGTIEVYSEPGEETTFSIHLKTGNGHFSPEQICEQQEESHPAIARTGSQEAQQQLLLEQEVLDKGFVGQSKATKILIVEDNEPLREMLVKIFEDFYTVITATNGKEGLDMVQSEHPNMVLSDVVMPEMSGTELCKLIKGDIETCHIPVVLLTARTAIEHNLEGLRMGADDYITKPFNVNILLSRCNNLVNNRIILQEKFSKQPQAMPQILATNPLDKELVDTAMKVIEEHMDDIEFSVDTFAREMGMARTKLFTKLKAITGQTPYDFISTVRLKRAAIMLKENPELNVSEISDRLGFSSPRQFSKSFKEKYHVVPQAYRRGDTKEDTEEEEEQKKE